MSSQINLEVLKQCVGRVGQTFATKDVSEQQELRAAHPVDANHSQWHALIGRTLSEHRGYLDISYVGRSSRGAKWSKDAVVSAVAAVSATSADGDDALLDLGPQYSGDDAFRARIRFHQSWWRSHVLRVPYGTGPKSSDSSRFGNMLPADAANAGNNFLNPEIFAVAQRRMAEDRGALEPFRFMRNMLSSQPMCFNLFAPLVDRPERATRLLRALFGDEVATVRRVELEWAPTPAHEYLDDRTAFDAMVEYERPDGELAVIGIETKLTDSFSQNVYDRPQYRRWMTSSRSPFRQDAGEDIARPRFNQLWRNHLLALAMRDRAGSPYASARSVVVHHPLDVDAGRFTTAYRDFLLPDNATFVVRPLDQVVASFELAASDDECPWLTAFRRRYVDLTESEPLWRARRPASRG